MALYPYAGGGKLNPPSRGPAWEEAERKKRQWAKDHYGQDPYSPISSQPVLPSTPTQHVNTTGSYTPKPAKSTGPVPTTFTGPPSVSPELQALRDRAEAEDLVEMEYDPAENELYRIMQQIGLSRDRDVATQERYGELQDTRLNQIYNALSEQLSASQGRMKDLYSGAQEGAREAYGQASEQAGEAASQVRDLLGESANRLGLGAALSDPMAQLEGQLKTIQSENEQSAAGATAELGNIGADLQALVEYDIMNAGREGTQERANLANIVADNIGQVQTMANEAIYQNMGQLADVALKRGAALRNAYREVVDARTEKERQQRLDQLAEEVQRNTIMLQNRQMELQESQFGLQKEESLFSRGMTQAEFDLKKSQLEAQIAQANSPEERMRAQLELEKLMAETQLAQAKAQNEMMGGGGGGQYKGAEGVYQYASQLGAPGAADDALRIARGVATFDEAHEAINANIGNGEGQYSQQEAALLHELIDVYFGNYSSYKN